MFSSTPPLRYVLSAACSLLVPNIAFAHGIEGLLIIPVGVLLTGLCLILPIGLYKTNKNGGSIGRKIARCILSLLLFIGMSAMLGGLAFWLFYLWGDGRDPTTFECMSFTIVFTIFCSAYFAPKLARKIIK